MSIKLWDEVHQKMLYKQQTTLAEGLATTKFNSFKSSPWKVSNHITTEISLMLVCVVACMTIAVFLSAARKIKSKRKYRKLESLETCADSEATKGKKFTYPNKQRTDVSTFVTKSIDKSGSRFNLGDYTVEFPAWPKRKNVEVTLCLKQHVGQFRVKNVDYFCAAPVLCCEPSGTSFTKEFKVQVKSAYFSRKKTRPVKVFVFVRQNAQLPWEHESTTTLGVDGKIEYKADHFSDRAVVIEASERSGQNLGWKISSFGYRKNISERATEVTWCLVKSSGNSFDQINQHQARDNCCIPLDTFKYYPGHDLLLRLKNDSGELVFRPLEARISRDTLADGDAVSKNFLLRLAPDVDAANLDAMPVEYTVHMENETNRREKVRNGFHLNWTNMARELGSNVVNNIQGNSIHLSQQI